MTDTRPDALAWIEEWCWEQLRLEDEALSRLLARMPPREVNEDGTVTIPIEGRGDKD